MFGPIAAIVSLGATRSRPDQRLGREASSDLISLILAEPGSRSIALTGAQHDADQEPARLAEDLVLGHLGQPRERDPQAIGKHQRLAAPGRGEPEDIVAATVDARDPLIRTAGRIRARCERDRVRDLVADQRQLSVDQAS
jgi:hypothetical protein